MIKENIIAFFRTLLFCLSALYLLLTLAAYFVSDEMIFAPPTPLHSEESFTLLSLPDGTQISSIYLPNPKATYTILYSHGNAVELTRLMPFLRALRDQGYNVFAYDYPGYGLSSGEPTEASCYQAVLSSYAYLVNEQHIAPEHIIAYGRSLGSAMAIYLGAEKPIAGLIIESGFVSAYRVVTRVPILPFDKFQNIERIPYIKVPVLVIHGRDDKVVPFWHGKALFHHAKAQKNHFWVDGAGHNNLASVAGESLWSQINNFTQTL